MADNINPAGSKKGLGVNFLPNFYKTDANKRFLQATIDQLVQPGTVKKINGYIGRQYAKATTGADIFVEAADKNRQNYQLEPSFTVSDTLGNNTFFKDYIDYINQLAVFGANTSNHARLNKQEFYSWDPHIDWDKFVNFQNYYWLPYGPQTIKIYGQQQNVVSSYSVTFQATGANNQYVFAPDGLTANPVLKLYRGQTYRFEINSAGNPFSIKTARTTSSADIYSAGVTNNSIETGTLIFKIPANSPNVLYYQSETDVNLGGVFQIYDIDENSFIDVAADIIGKKSYTLNNGIKLSSGMKLSFGGNVNPVEYATGEYYVEGVGTSIQLINKSILEVSSVYSKSEVLKFDSTPFDSDGFGDSTGFAKTLDYIVINRSSLDHNPWSRYNRWFHKDVIEASATYNNAIVGLDQTLRAVRPIIEFEANLKLFNFGTTAVADIDLIDSFTTDAFSIVEGKIGYNVDSISLAEGQQILFLADTDRLVKNNLYKVEFIDVLHSSAGSRQIRLVKMTEPVLNQVVLVKQGTTNQGLMYWYNGTTWLPAQQKTDVNQAPLFDVVDDLNQSFANKAVYDGSTFAGTQLFSYKVGSGAPDTNLGFALSYKNIANIGDIVFNFNLATDTFQYKDIVNIINKSVKTGYLVKTNYTGNINFVNGWQIGTTPTTQAAIRIYKNSNKKNNFNVDIFDDVLNLDDLIVRVYINGKRLAQDHWSLITKSDYKNIVLNTDILFSDVLTIRAFSAQPINANGFYEIPVNLKNNPLNSDIADFTLGEVIDHVDSIIDNIYVKESTLIEDDLDSDDTFIGVFPGSSNLRDLGNVTQYGTKFVQHSGPASLSLYHITSSTNNIVRAVEQARDSYNQFKRNFISIATSLGVNTTPIEQVNLILQEINKDKPINFPYYFSDMVPYRASTKNNITVLDGRIKFYPLANVFDLDKLSNKSVGVYLNGVQLIHKKDYTFDNQGFVNISAVLAEDDVISIYEYDSTDGSFIPETPTKLGIWPKYEPKLYLDTSLRTPRMMIQGHDGSQILAYNDYRDNILLELEKRIFNNIKISYDTNIFDIADIIPSYNRTTDYSLTEFNEILAPSFYKWSSLIDRDFTKPISYNKDDSFTFNYTGHNAPDGRRLPGYWKGIYHWILDTDRPNICPWEMLGLTIEPLWWQEVYGPAPYTRDNRVMWQDIADGAVREPGVPTTYLKKYAKPFLMKHIPVDEFGNLISPLASGLSSSPLTARPTDGFIFGDISPVESTWRRSSYYAFSVILTSILSTPSKTFGVLLDRSKIVRNRTGQLIYKDTGLRATPADIILPSIYSSTTRKQTSGILNYIVNYILSDNLKSYTDYQYDLSNIKTQLSYRVAGFTSKEKFNLLLDSKNPLSAGNVFVPPENYTTILNISSPVRKITYSGVIITKISNSEYEVKGYSKTQPFFKIYNFLQSGITINVGGISESFTNWESDQNYVAGKVVKFANKFYRITVSHLSTDSFNPNNFKSLTSLPIIGGRDAILRKTWDKEFLITIPYGTRFTSPQEVVDFLVGYGEWLKDQGFIFDDFNTTLNAVTNWETSAKEFLFWSTQNWATGQEKWLDWSPVDAVEYGNVIKYNGDYYQALRKVEASSIFDEELFVKLDGLSSIGSPVISLSPAADKIIFNANLCVIDDIRNPFNGYEIFKADGTPLESIFINSYREDNAVSYSSRTSDGIYGASFYLIQHEHVVLLDNSTMFNDTIYSPSTGYKQDRIKVAGYVSNDWYGGLDIPGFILDIANIQNWLAWQDYDLGDIVKYKQFFYTASKFLVGAQTFVAENWIKLDKKPVTQLLPNWSYKAAQFEDFYSLDSDNFDSNQQKMAQHLIGYQKRQYLENIIQNDVSEFKFYQGMIIEKGTQNSLNKLFDVLSAEGEDSLTFYEEWAIRAGQYGASSAFDNVEFILDESLVKNNPQGYELSDTTNSLTDFIIRQNANQVYLKPMGYSNNPWPVINNYRPFLRSAGYVRSSEVFLSLKTLSDITSYDITAFTNKCYIWVTFEKNDWNVYQFTNSDINVSDLQYDSGSTTLTVTTTQLLTLTVGEYIGLSQAPLLNGFYKVASVSQNKFTISITIKGWSQQLVPALILKINVNVLISRRLPSIDSIDQSITSNLELGEQIWTDDTGTGKWASWEYTPIYETTELTNSSPASLLNYGRFITSNQQGTLVTVSTNLGELQTWDKAGYKSPWLQRQNIQRPYISSLAGTGTIAGPAGNLPKNIATVTAISPDGQWLATGSKLASNLYTRIKLSGPYVVGDIVYNSGDTYYYEAITATSSTTFSNGNVWKKLLYVPVSLLPGVDSGLIEQGVISLYKKDSNNVFTIINSIVSPTPADYEHFGSNLVFGDNVLYITASGYNYNAGKIYKLQYTTTEYKTAYYNPVGSSDSTLALSRDVGSSVNPNVGILPGMTISGEGFTSGQTVLEVSSNGTSLTISAAADSTPSGKLSFSFTGWGYDKEETYEGAIADANLGSSLAISSNNNTLIVSSNNGITSGKVLIVTNPGPDATQQILQGTTTSFGETISLSSDASYLAIGDKLTSGNKQFQGNVTVYEKTSTGYVSYQELVNHKAEESGYFGSRVAFMNGSNTLVVYSSYEDTIIKTSLDQYATTLSTFSYVGADDTVLTSTYVKDSSSARNEYATTFDKDSTRFVSINVDSGRIDIYDKYSNNWVYSETLNNTLKVRDGYGIGFAVGNDRVVVGAPYALDRNLVSGKVFDYLKPPATNSWTIKYQEVDKPDVTKIRKAFLYNRVTGKLLTYLDVIDVAQGRPAGSAAEEIKYQSFYDPAIYSVGTGTVNVDADSPWNKSQVGRLWWDLRTAKFINSYDSDVMYRTNTWNTLATGASIDIYEWVETTLQPDAWNKSADTEAGIAAGISGTSLYGNGVYALRQRYDSISQSFKNTYYYWVKNKKTIPNVSGRYLSAQAVASLIENPRGQGYSYLALTGTNSFSLVNSKQYLKDTEVILSVEYWTIDKINSNVHSQWKIINNDASTVLPAAVELKWFDSLCGKDLAGREVPDVSLPPKLRYGIENRPRQSMFVNRFEALKQYIEQVNLTLKDEQIVTTRDISKLKLYDTAPSLVTGLYDSTENTDAEIRFVNVGAYKRPVFGNPIIVDGRITGLDIQFAGRGYVQAPYINITGSGTGAKVRAIINAVGQITGVAVLSAGEGYDSNTIASVRDYSVLIYSDSQALGNWALYSYEPIEKVWSRIQSQTYNTQKYWDYADWFATGYNQFIVADHAVDTLAELSSITVEIGQLVKIQNKSSGNWLFVEKYANNDLFDYTRSYNVVGIGNGTIQFSSAIYESISTDEGYDGSTYDGAVFDNAPTTEIRIILTALKDDILIDELRADYLDLFFTTVRYALSEQIYLDWIFKSSFIKARHNVGLLSQPVTYKNDNLANYQEYIAEVKPYKTKIREYVSSYQNTELSSTLISDFDLPPRYKNNKIVTMNAYVSQGSLVTLDSAFNSYPWKNWVDNLGFVITELKIIAGGSGYITEPVVRIISDSGSGATARVFFSNGIINRVVLLTPGSGYLSAPTIIIDGGILQTGTSAQVIAVIGKGLPRSNLIQIKFDRITQSYYVTHLEETETFSPNGARLQFPLTWAPDNTIGSSIVTVSGVTALRDSYKLSVVSTKTNGSTKYSGLVTFDSAPTGNVSVTYKKNAALLNAADRINYFYNPQEGDIGNDLSQLMTGIDYGGVVVTGLGFDISTGWGVLPYFTDKWDSVDSTFDDYIVTVSAGTHTFPSNPADSLPTTWPVGSEINIYHTKYDIETHAAVADQLVYSYNVNKNSPSVSVVYPTTSAGVDSNYDSATIYTTTTLKVVNTTGIQAGMIIIGTGFTSGQTVIERVNGTTLTISAKADSEPNGTLHFTHSIRGGFTVQMSSTTGISVGDIIKTTSVSAFGYGTVVTEIVEDVSVVLDQIIYENLLPGTALEFSRDLIIPTNVNIYTAGIITLRTPAEVGSIIKITGNLGPYRLDDPDFGTPQQSITTAVVTTTTYTGNITQTVSIPNDYVINDNDTIILRRSTSDGSIKSQDTDYDTALSGGEFTGNYSTGVFTSATGILPDDIILDGDDLISPTTSPAPEEVVPGQVVDTVAIKVYDQPPSGSANIKIANYLGDNVTTTFDIGQTPNSKEAVIVKWGNNILDLTEYTVDYKNRTVTLNQSPITPGQQFGFGLLGESGQAERGQGIAVDTDSNFYVTGYTGFDGEPTTMFLVKYNSSGVIQWQANLAGVYPETKGLKVTVDSSGNTYVVGSDRIQTAPYTMWLIVAKFNSAGVLVWQRKIETNNNTVFNSITIDGSNNLYIVSSNYTSVSNCIVFKYNDAGSLLWQRDFHSNTGAGTEGTGVAVDLLGNVYACGRAFGSGTIVKYNSLGVYQSVYSLVGATLWGITTDSSNNVYVTGYITDGSKTSMILAKFNSSSVIEWQRVLSTTTNVWGYSVKADAVGNVYVTGFGTSDPWNAYIVKYNTLGLLLWQRTIDSGSGDIGFDMAIGSTGNIYVTGALAVRTEEMFFAKLPADGSLMGTGTVSGIDITYAESSMDSATGTLVYVSGVPDGPMGSSDPALPESESALLTSLEMLPSSGTLATPAPVAPTTSEIVSIYSIGFNGSNILDIDHFVGDGITQEFITRAPWLTSTTTLIYVDGIPVTPDIFKTDNTYNSVNRVAMRFGVAPAAGALLSFIVVAGDQQSFAVTKTERIITNGSNVYSLEYKIGDALPNESNMVVRVNNTIVPGPVNSYFKISNNRLNYTIEPTKVTPYSTAIGNIFVYVGNIKLNLGSDYTIDLGGITVKINKLIYSQYAKQTLVVSVTADQGYSYSPTTNQITFAESYSSLDIVEVISSYKHDILDIERTMLTVSSNLSLTPDSVEYYSYKGITNGTLALDRAVISDSYVWVIQNETILVPSIDYKLNEGRTSVQLTVEPAIDDKITLMTFGSNILMAGISYMQFKDMLNRVHYKRLSLNKRTALATNLNFNDRTIRVRNADTFDKPNPLKNKPGIIEIRGERIEFYELNGNVLSKLRRGTLGTGTPLVHKAGTYVQEIGPTESIPYVDSSIVEQVISDGESIVIPLNFTPAKSSIDQWFTNFGFTLKGNYNIAGGYNATDVVIYNSLYYVNIKSYVFDSVITVLPTNTTYWKLYTTTIPVGHGQCDEIEVFVGGYDTSVNWLPNVTYLPGIIVTLGSYTYKCLTEHASTSNFKNDIANWTFFIGNIRLKKSPYKMHNENQAPNSPLGDIKLDAEFSVDGVSPAVRLTYKLSFGTRITIIKRNGTDWDSATNIQYDNSKIAEFLKATPGVWYAENQLNTEGPVPAEPSSFDSASTRFDGTNLTFDQG